jgi:hypothetical protein
MWLVHLFWTASRSGRKAVSVTEKKVAPRRRLDHGLYLSEGVIVLGAAIFLIGFGIEKSSNTPGRVLEVAGFLIFALGLFAAGAFAFLLSQHFARTSAAPAAPYPRSLDEGALPHFSYLGSRMRQAVGDPAATLVREATAKPENDIARARLIERERQGFEGGE